MRWSALFVLFFCFACQSKPAQTAETPLSSTLEAKVTREAPAVAQAEVGTKIVKSPRKAQEIEVGLLGHPEVKKCVDAAVNDKNESFDVILEGAIAKSGAIENPVLTRSGKTFELCLPPALKGVNLGNGRAGTFKMQLFRKDSKKQIKKFE